MNNQLFQSNLTFLLLFFLLSSIVTVKAQEETSISTLKDLHQNLLKKAKENEFSGNVLIAKDGNPIFELSGWNTKKEIIN